MTKIATEPDFEVEIDYDKFYIDRTGIDGGLLIRVSNFYNFVIFFVI